MYLVSGCGKQSNLGVPGLTDLHVKSDSEINCIESHTPQNGNEIQVIVVGPSVHTDIPSGIVVLSKISEGYMGKVTVEIKDGMIFSIIGNSVFYGNPLDIEDLKKIKRQLGSVRDHLTITTIK